MRIECRHPVQWEEFYSRRKVILGALSREDLGRNTGTLEHDPS